MKYKWLVITTIVFFLAVNTSYFWEGKLGLLVLPVFAILAIVYLGLVIAFLRHLFFAIRERFADGHRLFPLGLLLVVLCMKFLFPFGIINFDRISGEDLLVAQREGAANCMTTFKLKDNSTFIEKDVCFGITEVTGKYKVVHDTIYFENVEQGRHTDAFYQFALIRPSNFNNDKKHFDLVRFKNLSDTIGHTLWIIKNELNKASDKNRTATTNLAE